VQFLHVSLFLYGKKNVAKNETSGNFTDRDSKTRGKIFFPNNIFSSGNFNVLRRFLQIIKNNII